MNKVKITKIAISDNPEVDTPCMKDYKAGQDNGNVSLPVEYWIEGYLMNEPKIGTSVLVNRTSRNGVDCAGIFTTSQVTKILEDGFETLNSIYKVEVLWKPIE